MVYNLTFMDNLAYSSGDENSLFQANEICTNLLSLYGFELQKFASNSMRFNKSINCADQEEINLLGLRWNTSLDELKNKPPYLSPEANTLRSILSSVNSNYDPLGINTPIMNRAKLWECDHSAYPIRRSRFGISDSASGPFGVGDSA